MELQATQLLTGTTEINAACDQIKTQGKALDDYIQYTALSVLNHVELHGDVTVVNRLYLSMPKGSRRSALTEFLMANGKVSANSAENKKDTPFLYAKEKATTLDSAQAKPWYEWKPERAPDECFDLQAAVMALLGRAKKAGAVSDPEALVTLEAMAGNIKKPGQLPAPEALQ